MSMAAGAAVLRSSSAATKMGRAPPRLPTSSGGGGLCLPSRFSTSTGGGSMPPLSANLRGPQPHNKKDPSDSQWFRALDAFNKAAPIAAFSMLGICIIAHFTVSPALDRMEADMDARCQAFATNMEEIKKTNERTREMLLYNKGSQTEGADEMSFFDQ